MSLVIFFMADMVTLMVKAMENTMGKKTIEIVMAVMMKVTVLIRGMMNESIDGNDYSAPRAGLENISKEIYV